MSPVFREPAMTTTTPLRCPICGRATRFEDEPLGPFCSERCRTIDLGAWASETYRLESPPDWSEDEVFTEPSKPGTGNA